MTFQYAEPRTVESKDGLFFYHSIDLPGIGSIDGDWDLRGDAHAYLGNVDFKGKRVLDMGAGCGYLTFKMEELGADVVSFDIRAGSDWNIVPHYKVSDRLSSIRKQADISINRMKDAYWFCHAALKSKANAYYGDIYSIPDELGEFDVVFYGMILTHLRDPYWALYNGARLSRNKLVVTGIWSNDERPVSTFRPAANKTSNLDIKGWWLLSRGTIKAMAGTMGFEFERSVFSNVMVNSKDSEGPRSCEALVFQRSHIK